MKRVFYLLAVAMAWAAAAQTARAQLLDFSEFFDAQYVQTSASQVGLLSYGAGASAFFDSSTNASQISLQIPGESLSSSAMAGPAVSPYGIVSSFNISLASGLSSLADLNPYTGTAALGYTTPAGLAFSVNVSAPSLSSLNTLPVLKLSGASYAALQDFNPDASLTLHLKDYSGTSSSGIGNQQNIVLQITDAASGQDVFDVVLSATTASYTIPAGTLITGQDYILELSDVAENSTNAGTHLRPQTYAGEVINETSINFTPVPEPNDLFLMGSGVMVLSCRWRRGRQ